MTPETRETLDGYYERSGSWADDRLLATRKSQRTAWIVAGISALVAMGEAMALVGLAPLKTVVPYTLLVDKQTGYVQALNPIGTERIAPDAALTQSFLVQYVLARESYDILTVQSAFKKVALWSVDPARGDYTASMQITNPASPLNALPRSSLIEAQVRSVSSLGNNTAMIRFETVRLARGGTVQSPQSWVAIINYRYSKDPMSVADRYINPLGFQVTRYRKNAEALPQSLETSDQVPGGAAQIGGALPLPGPAR